MSELSKPLRAAGPIILISILSLLLVIGTLSLTWRITIFHLGAWVIGFGFVSIALFMTSVRFYSPLTVSEDGKVISTFESRAEVIYDKGWGLYLGVVFVNGYNSAKRAFSYQDVSTGGRATLYVTTDPFMIESVGGGRFLIVRGTPYEASRYESRAFLNRRSVKAALGDEVTSARLFFIFSSKTLKPDEMPDDPTKLGELASLFEVWRGEIADSVTRFEEDFGRKRSLIRELKTSVPIETVKRPKAEEREEERNGQR